jgi:hypothetical protein
MVHPVHSVIACTSASYDDNPWLTAEIVIDWVTGVFHLLLNLGIFESLVNDTLHVLFPPKP